MREGVAELLAAASTFSARWRVLGVQAWLTCFETKVDVHVTVKAGNFKGLHFELNIAYDVYVYMLTCVVTPVCVICVIII